MSISNVSFVSIPTSGVNAIVGSSAAVRCGDTIVGYEIKVGSSTAFTGTLQGSVGGEVWTDIDDFSASSNGLVPAYYQFVRVNVTVQELLDGATVKIVGKA